MATSSTTRPPAAVSLPCLFLDYGDRQPSTPYSVSDGARHPCEVDELRSNKRSWVTSHGWALVWDPATLATFLWDPHAAPNDNNRITLPSLTHPPTRAGCTLSTNPTDPNGYTVLLVDKSASLIYYCHVGHPASGSGWVRHEYDVGNIPLPSNDGSMKRIIYRTASCHGKFYYLRKHGEIGVIEFSSMTGAPVFSTTPMKGVQLTPVGDYMAAASAYLVDLDGELYVAYIFFHNTDFRTIIDVGVYRLDFDTKEPVRVDSIGDRAIFLGSSCSLGGWCPATTFRLLPNNVYWMSLHDGLLHVYDLEQKTEEVREPCSGVAEPSQKPFWLLPKHP